MLYHPIDPYFCLLTPMFLSINDYMIYNLNYIYNLHLLLLYFYLYNMLYY